MGLSLDDIATARVALVEDKLLKIQEEIRIEMAKVMKENDTIQNDVNREVNSFFRDESNKIEERFNKELKKTSFKDISIYICETHDNSVEKELKDRFTKTYKVSLRSRSSHYDLTIDTVKVSMGKEERAKIEKLEKVSREKSDQIDTLYTRATTVVNKLSHLDREKRKAQAIMVGAKINSMDGGKELLDMLSKDLPTV